jgi:hypothetical protein
MSGAERKKKESVGWGSELKKPWNEFSEAVNWKRRKVGLIESCVPLGVKRFLTKMSAAERKKKESVGWGLELKKSWNEFSEAVKFWKQRESRIN